MLEILMSDLQSDMTIEIESLVDTSYHPLKIPLRKEHSLT